MKRTTYNIDKMYTYLRGFLIGANMENSLKALQFAREKHKGQIRKDGVPYIVHPLSMACYAVALGIKDDNIIATVLLHDVVEDCDVPAEDRYNNLADMPFALSANAIGKNCAETELLLLPVLKAAKEKWADLSNILFVLRTNIRTINDILKLHYPKEYQAWFDEYDRKEEEK